LPWVASGFSDFSGIMAQTPSGEPSQQFCWWGYSTYFSAAHAGAFKQHRLICTVVSAAL
jgi:hypothetical protein